MAIGASLVVTDMPNYHTPRFIASFADIGGGADIDLAAQSSLPFFGPQQVLLHATAAATVTLFKHGETTAGTLVVQVGAGETVSIEGPIVGVDASGTTTAVVSMVAYWRHKDMPPTNA